MPEGRAAEPPPMLLGAEAPTERDPEYPELLPIRDAGADRTPPGAPDQAAEGRAAEAPVLLGTFDP